MVSINPIGDKNPIKETQLSFQEEEPDYQTSIWSKYDNSTGGVVGKVDEDELSNFVEIKFTKEDVPKEFKESAIDSIKNYVGLDWTVNLCSEITTKLIDFFTATFGKKEVSDEFTKEYEEITNDKPFPSSIDGEIDCEEKLYDLVLMLDMDSSTGEVRNPSIAEINFVKDKIYNSKYAKEHGDSEAFKEITSELDEILARAVITNQAFIKEDAGYRYR